LASAFGWLSPCSSPAILPLDLLYFLPRFRTVIDQIKLCKSLSPYPSGHANFSNTFTAIQLQLLIYQPVSASCFQICNIISLSLLDESLYRRRRCACLKGCRKWTVYPAGRLNWGIPRTTIQSRLYGREARQQATASLQGLSSDQEARLAT
jgi:hypothetical protein